MGLAASAGCGTDTASAPDGAVDDGGPLSDGSSADSGNLPLDVAFAIMGDSNSDEYRADDNRGGAYAAVTFNWMEQLVMARGLDFGPTGTWGGSRRSGFEYNWARSGARADDLVGQGQAAGVAQQVSDGLVDYVYVEIGANDFHQVNGTYLEIYDGTLSDPQVTAKVAQVVADIESAVDTVLQAGPTTLFLRTLGDPALAPGTALAFPDVDGRARVSAAIAQANADLVALAATRPLLTVLDTEVLAMEMLANVDPQTGTLVVGGEVIDLVTPGDEPHHGRLGDSSGHAGTVLSGLVANMMFIEPINEAEGLGIAPFTEAEILSHAGL